MNGVAKDWLIVIAFFVGFFVFTFAEAAWVARQTRADYARSLFFAFTSNIISTTVGLFGSFVAFFLVLSVVWDGSLSDPDPNRAALWTAFALGILSPLVVLTVAKRVLISVTKLELKPGPWGYSTLASIAFYLFISLVVAASAMIL